MASQRLLGGGVRTDDGVGLDFDGHHDEHMRSRGRTAAAAPRAKDHGTLNQGAVDYTAGLDTKMPTSARGDTPEAWSAVCFDDAATTKKISHIQYLNAGDVYFAMNTSREGLSSHEAARRIGIFGPNKIVEPPKRHVLLQFFSHFIHLMALLLWGAGGLAMIGDSVTLGVAIWMVNVLNGVFGFYNEYAAGRAADALRKMLPANARVVRNGQMCSVPAEELVPGDVMILTKGEQLCADARVVEGSNMKLDQSTFTGEAETRAKSKEAVPRDGQRLLTRTSYSNLLFSGTSVVAGDGVAIVLATGMNTEFGKVARITLNVDEQPSPIQREMEEATKYISVIAICVGVLFFLLTYFLVHVSFEKTAIFAIGMVTAFIPEGLLPLVTLSLARASLRMANQGVIIKRLSAVETLGCASVICSDKTGTITRNEMTAQCVWLGGATLRVTGEGYGPDGVIVADPNHENDEVHLRDVLTVCALCNESSVSPPTESNAQWTKEGQPTEAALLVLATKGGVNRDDERKTMPQIGRISFSSERRRMTTIHRLPMSQAHIALVKGAPSTLLELSTRARWCDGARELTAEDKETIMAAARKQQAQGQRVLALASHDLGVLEDEPRAEEEAGHVPELREFDADEVERDLTFLGLVAIRDPPRAAVKPAVQDCHKAGIRVLILTGDNGVTATSIAEAIGMEGPGGRPLRTILGDELNAMTDPELEALLDEGGDIVFARTRPKDKLRVVIALRKKHVVAVTGDGVNDAPALKRADIGVAMGIGGTDVAMQSADIILVNNSFNSIVDAIREGRAVYENIKKFLTYILASNMAEAIPFIFFIATEGRIPLALPVLVVLAIDLGTDMIPALALGADPPHPSIMSRPPRDLKERFFKPSLLFRGLLWLGLYEGVAAMAAFYYQFWTMGEHKFIDLPPTGPIYTSAVSMAFAAVVFSQVGCVFACRSDCDSFRKQNFFNNRLLWWGVLFEVVFLAVCVYVPSLEKVFGLATVPVYPSILMMIGLTVGILLWSDVLVAISNCCRARAAKKKREQESDAHMALPDGQGGVTV